MIRSGTDTLLVGSEKSASAIAALLGGSYSTVTITSGALARQKLLDDVTYRLAIVKTPLTDEFGDELAALLAEKGIATILLVASEHADEYAARLSPSGVMTVALPIVRRVFAQSIDLALAAHARIAELTRENRKLRIKLDEARKICRAKCLLIEHEGMSEETAHRYVEKRAMDLRLSASDVAAMIVERYE